MIDGCRFEDTAGDAFDGDFSDGRIVDTRFTRCTNDAIDVSGSQATVENVQVRTAGDKAISSGEQSAVTVRNLAVEEANIAVASKDLSLVQIEGGRIERCRFGFAAYQKKPEFGPGRIVADGVELAEVEQAHMIELGSTFSENGTTVDGTEKRVYRQLTPPEQRP